MNKLRVGLGQQTCFENEEDVVIEIDKQRTEAVRRSWPFFHNRRIDFYGGLGKRYLN